MMDLQNLRQDLKDGQVLIPGDAGYDTSLKRWNAACEKKAAVVVQPTSANEVSTAVKFAVTSKLPLTVCGGGHSTSGTSSSEGIVIDMCKMRDVYIDVDGMTVTFGGGCLWEHLDGALEKQGLGTVGGVVNHTGVGGLILGGGHGYLTALHGLTIDNLISVEVVLADGSVVEASESQNPDLFWALRGAGAQFGVATRFVSRVHRQGKVWSGTLEFKPDKLPQLVSFANEFHDRDNREGHCLVLALGYASDGSRAIPVIPLFQGSEEDGKQYFSGLLDIGATANNTGMMSIAQMNTLLNPVSEHGIRRLMGSSTLVMPLDADEFRRSAEMFWAFGDSRPGMGVSAVAVELFPTHRIREVAQDATAYANRGDYYDVVTAFGWSDEGLDGEIRAFNRSLCEHFRKTNGYRPALDGSGAGPVGRYINIEADEVSPQDAYGGNLSRLRELKNKYDPKNVFHKWHSLNGAEKKEE